MTIIFFDVSLTKGDLKSYNQTGFRTLSRSNKKRIEVSRLPLRIIILFKSTMGIPKNSRLVNINSCYLKRSTYVILTLTRISTSRVELLFKTEGHSSFLSGYGQMMFSSLRIALVSTSIWCRTCTQAIYVKVAGCWLPLTN